MAERLGVKRSAVSQWVKDGKLPPARAIQIEAQSKGVFKAIDIPCAQLEN